MLYRIFAAQQAKQQFKILTEEKSRFDFNHNALRCQPQCFAVFGFIKAHVDLFTFAMSSDCASRGIVTFYPTEKYSFLTVFLLQLSLIFLYFLYYQNQRHQRSSGSHIPRTRAVKLAFGEFTQIHHNYLCSNHYL